MATLAPLESTRYCILLALAKRPLHAYGIMEQIDKDGGQLIHLDYSTIHKSLGRLEVTGHVKRDKPDPNARTIRFRITPLGKRTLKIETDRLAQAVRFATERL